MKKFMVNTLYTAGVGIGIYAALFRTIEIITYSEFKVAAILTVGLCSGAFALSRAVRE